MTGSLSHTAARITSHSGSSLLVSRPLSQVKQRTRDEDAVLIDRVLAAGERLGAAVSRALGRLAPGTNASFAARLFGDACRVADEGLRDAVAVLGEKACRYACVRACACVCAQV